MDEEWALIFTSDQLYEIELLSGMLEENEIESVIINKQDSAYLIGDIELHIHIDNIMKAKILISKFSQSE
ncbi:MAG: hypothetical protein ACOYO1_09445 [Bacteroidales bacterium]